MARTCKRVHYGGDVQGVGFRYTARGLAQSYPIAGYVKNLADGRVELVAEGEAVDVDRFLDAVSRRMASYIADQDVEEVPPQEYAGFEIRH